MITSIRLVNFKNFADETLKVGPFTVIVGANASGKSNIRDAFRFLHGIGRGYTLAEIMGGKYGPGGQREWAGIRGAPGEVVRYGQPNTEGRPAFSIGLELNSAEDKISYSISVGIDSEARKKYSVLSEELKVGQAAVYGTEKDSGSPNLQVLLRHESEEPVELNRGRPALTQVADMKASPDSAAARVRAALASLRFPDFSPERLREPSTPGATMLGDRGENLPGALEAICADPQRKMILLSWLEDISPMNVTDFEFPRDSGGGARLCIAERNGRRVSASVASDGFLRYLGILAALLAPDREGLHFFEEPDKSIYAHRLWLLEDFLKRQAERGGVQVIATTHSPALLSWMRDGPFENTSIVYRDEYWADSIIRPIAGLYNLREVRKSTTLGELHTEGWMEAAMKFSEGDPDSDHWEDDDEDDWEQGILE